MTFNHYGDIYMGQEHTDKKKQYNDAVKEIFPLLEDDTKTETDRKSVV